MNTIKAKKILKKIIEPDDYPNADTMDTSDALKFTAYAILNRVMIDYEDNKYDGPYKYNPFQDEETEALALATHLISCALKDDRASLRLIEKVVNEQTRPIPKEKFVIVPESEPWKAEGVTRKTWLQKKKAAAAVQ